jgi:large subunit ribosomal protein L10
MAKAAEYKKKLVEDMVKLMRQYHIIGLVNMSDMPTPQLQLMRKEMRGKIELFMTKKRLMKIALEKIKNEKGHLEELEKYFEGMPALLFTNENPFKLSKMLQKSKASAPAKAGQIAPEDITIKKGPTPFAPGPVISELSSVGLKVGVEDGKVAVKEDTVVAKKGEEIKPKVAEILARLDIKPMEVGLGLLAAYEDGIIYEKDILKIDEKAFNEKVNLAATQVFNLAFNIAYVTKDNVNLLISKAFSDAKAIGISQKILDNGIIEELLSEAERSMLGLKTTANIQAVEKPKEEAKEKAAEEPATKEETPQEVKEEIKKEEPKPEPKKEEPKAEEKKIEAPVQEEVKKKEEKILEEEKEIVEEEKKLEQEKPKDVPAEREVQEAVKKEEEKKLERERTEKEKELEKVEEQKPTPEIKESTPEIRETDTDTKVKQMVEKTKKFIEGTEETAADIIEDVKKEGAQEEKIEEQKKEKEEKIPTAHDLKEQKEAKEENKENKEQKEVEELTKELIKKGTLRKNKQ